MQPNDVTELDDEMLVARARSGDRAAFAALLRRHQRAALRVAAVVSGSTEEADDIVQEAFVTVHRRLDSYRATGTVRSWILRIVANHAKNHVRGRVRRLRRDDRHAGLQLREVAAIDDDVVRQDEQRTLVAALERLRPADREVLACRYLGELSEAETAVVLGVAQGTVKSRASRALARLRVEMGAAT